MCIVIYLVSYGNLNDLKLRKDDLKDLEVIYLHKHFFKHFSTTSQQQQKLDLELSYETQPLHDFFLFCFKTTLKDFPFY